MKTLVVVNPNSSNGATGREWPKIRKSVEEAVGSFTDRLTTGPGHATDLVRESLAAGTERIISVGGDGTNNEVINGFFERSLPVNPQAMLGFIPRGTGGDLRKTLGIGRSLDECLGVLRACKTRQVDAGDTRFMDHQGKQTRRTFINITSFGIGGLVDKKVNESTKAFGGKVSFLLGTLRALATYRNQLVHLKVHHCDEVVLDQSMRVNNVAVANGQYYGGGMWVAPQARIDDGLFDLTIQGDLSKLEIIMGSSRIYKGTHLELPKISTFRGSHVEATSDEEVLVDMDGEQPGRLPITLDILPQAVRLIVP